MFSARWQSPRTLTLLRRVSMTIYTSDKAVPYVYVCTHKETDQFYIGYREKNVKSNTPSHLDLPEYKTSSKIVNPDFSNYTWTIVAEFFDPSHAYIFEQQLICDNWGNPLLLNGYYRLGKIKQFRNSGPNGRKGKPTGKQQNPSSKPSWNKGGTSWNKGIPTSDATKEKQSAALVGVPSKTKGIKRDPCSDETKQKMRDAKKGIPTGPSPKKGKPSGRKGKPNGKQRNPSNKPAWNKGNPNGQSAWNRGMTQTEVECPHCGKTGGISAMKRWHFDNCKLKPLL